METSPSEERKYDLKVTIAKTRRQMGEAAAQAAAQAMRALGREKEKINIIFAAAPSQNEFLSALAKEKDLPWEKVRAFQMDDYVDLDEKAPQRFSNYLEEHIWSQVPLGRVERIAPVSEEESEAEILRYDRLLREHPIDIAFIGIGENGHIAFNDPDVADFFDPLNIKKIPMDEVSRLQQVHDGCFAALKEVPRAALTVTLPPILRARHIICTVPALAKAQAVKDALCGPIGTACPASALRLSGRAQLFLDEDSASLLKEKA